MNTGNFVPPPGERRAFFITGATGNLGFAVVRELLTHARVRVVVLVRDAAVEVFRASLSAALSEVEVSRRVELVRGDVRQPFCGVDPERLGRITDVVHCAADVGWTAPAQQLLDVNVKGTSNLLDLCALLHRRSPLRGVTAVSSAYVAGCDIGVIPEAPLAPRSFNNAYEVSKFLAERVALERSDLPVCVLRPSSIVGDSRDGWLQNFSTLYQPFRLILEDRLRVLPGLRDARLDFIPVDYAARTIVSMHDAQLPRGTIVHACAGHNSVDLPSLWELACATCDDLLPLAKPRRTGVIVPPGLFRATQGALAAFVPPRSVRQLAAFVPYLSLRRHYRIDMAHSLGLPAPPPLRDYLRRICQFAIEHAFVSASRRGPSTLRHARTFSHEQAS